jgi:putative aminopeptidase FrvX
MHSPVEVVSLKDLEAIPRLMAAFVRSVKSGDKFEVTI